MSQRLKVYLSANQLREKLDLPLEARLSHLIANNDPVGLLVHLRGAGPDIDDGEEAPIIGLDQLHLICPVCGHIGRQEKIEIPASGGYSEYIDGAIECTNDECPSKQRPDRVREMKERLDGIEEEAKEQLRQLIREVLQEELHK